jgi:methylthioribose-1-phosphate isomerase
LPRKPVKRAKPAKPVKLVKLVKSPRIKRVAELRPVACVGARLRLLDQRKLPGVEVYVQCRGAADTARAIREMVVRGAPAIGVTAAYGLALAARGFRAGRLREDFDAAAKTLVKARPTAVNLAWAVERLRGVFDAELSRSRAASPRTVIAALRSEADRMLEEDIAINRALGRHGAPLLAGADAVLTHCNAGALATAGYGTAVGVIRAAYEGGKALEVFATETRPYLQGSRLTAWEFQRLGIPVTLITDSMVGHLLKSGRIGAVVVGTDRTAASGDVANKIGTYPIAVLARRHGVPFYVAAPTPSIDLDCVDGSAIPIEERDPREITHIGGRRIAARGIKVYNPAFDVTPAELVSGIITEHGVVRSNYPRNLARMKNKRQPRSRKR